MKKKQKKKVTLVRLKKGALVLARAAGDIHKATAALPYDMEDLSQRFERMRDRFCDDAPPSAESSQLKLMTQQVQYYAGRIAVLLYGLEQYTKQLHQAARDLKRHRSRTEQ